VKIGILLLFLVLGLGRIDPGSLGPANWAPTFRLVTGGMIIFVAYEGFELIAVVTMGVLSVLEVVQAKDYALARAAKPFMGSVGFTVITIAAVNAANLRLFRRTRSLW
jgi:hypothetical protein